VAIEEGEKGKGGVRGWREGKDGERRGGINPGSGIDGIQVHPPFGEISQEGSVLHKDIVGKVSSPEILLPQRDWWLIDADERA
jgi:hypothetical protein